tara:strand:- start:6555 stop:7322 length:768 start_codon:yes stop_codon:yes gene_type:complete
MFRPRVIPVLLLKDLGLVKGKKFKNYTYIGDPINAVKIFNDLGADELIFLDIEATNEKRLISMDFVKKVGAEANMPFGVGGGICKINQIKEIIALGAEKVVLNTSAVNDFGFIESAVQEFGSSTVVVSVDVKKTFFKGLKVFTNSGRNSTNLDPLEHCMKMEELGVGEIILNSIDCDGMMNGYDLKLIENISKSISIPVVASCGAGKFDDFNEAIFRGKASAVAAGSMFVFHGPRNAVLINYPEKIELNKLKLYS